MHSLNTERVWQVASYPVSELGGLDIVFNGDQKVSKFILLPNQLGLLHQ